MKGKFGNTTPFLHQLSFVLIVWIMLDSLFLLDMAGRHDMSYRKREMYGDDSLVTLLFAGDVMGHKPQVDAAYDRATGQYDYSDCFRYVEPYIQSADFACANLEVTLGGPPYTGYPCFSSPDALLFEVQNTGFDLLFTANNHVLDRGKKGVERTIKMLDSVGMPHAGSYVDSISCDTSYPIIMDVKGLKVGFINATYGTNGIKEKAPNVVNKLDTVQMARNLERLDEMGADLKVAVLHWGNEYELKGNKSQLRCAQSLVNHGADLIIGGHPHVVQNADTIFNASGEPIVLYYSLGNFISNQQKLETKGGIMVKVTVNRFTGHVEATEYIPYFVFIGTIHGKHQYYVVPCVPYLNGAYDFSLPKHDSTLLHTEYNAISRRLSNFTQSTE
jgi:poly-gamma-glutamate synthesis protein (capsule biosynthesis protein)